MTATALRHTVTWMRAMHLLETRNRVGENLKDKLVSEGDYSSMNGYERRDMDPRRERQPLTLRNDVLDLSSKCV
jgi:hypothetical protein